MILVHVAVVKNTKIVVEDLTNTYNRTEIRFKDIIKKCRFV